MIPIKDTVRATQFPLVNTGLIAVNSAFFLYEASLGRGLVGFVNTWGLVPERFLSSPDPFQWVTLFTSMFLHGGWFHLISNMLALYIFGDNVEDRMGHLRYLIFYLLCGVAAGLTHVFLNPDSPVPTVGASGAISGVLAAYLVLFPTATVIGIVPVLFFGFLAELPAVLYIGVWFFSQLLNGVFSLLAPDELATLGGVAWWAHVGGFVAGLALVKLFARRRSYYYLDEYWPW